MCLRKPQTNVNQYFFATATALRGNVDKYIDATQLNNALAEIGDNAVITVREDVDVLSANDQDLLTVSVVVVVV